VINEPLRFIIPGKKVRRVGVRRIPFRPCILPDFRRRWQSGVFAAAAALAAGVALAAILDACAPVPMASARTVTAISRFQAVPMVVFTRVVVGA